MMLSAGMAREGMAEEGAMGEATMGEGEGTTGESEAVAREGEGADGFTALVPDDTIAMYFVCCPCKTPSGRARNQGQ